MNPIRVILAIICWPILALLWVLIHIAVIIFLLGYLIFKPKKFTKALLKEEWKQLRILDKMLNPLWLMK